MEATTTAQLTRNPTSVGGRLVVCGDPADLEAVFQARGSVTVTATDPDYDGETVPVGAWRRTWSDGITTERIGKLADLEDGRAAYAIDLDGLDPETAPNLRAAHQRATSKQLAKTLAAQAAAEAEERRYLDGEDR